MSLRLSGVGKRYADDVALDGLDLTAEDGELLVLLGPSGSGKTTALRLLAGLETPDTGTVEVAGRDVTGVPPHQRDVAMVFQDYALFPHLTVKENLRFGLRLRRTPRDEADRAAADAAARLGVGDLLDRYPDQLSGGQQQRVALARALLRRPSAFLLDEPLSNLDAQLRTSTRELVVELHRAVGVTTVVVTHDQLDAMTMADRVAVLADGRLQQVGPPQEVYDRPATAFVAAFVGGPAMNLLPGGGLLGGEPGTLVGVRPEDLQPDDRGRIEGVVELVEALGSETVLRVRAGDEVLRVRLPPRSGLVPGDVARLAARSDRLHVFDAETGLRR